MIVQVFTSTGGVVLPVRSPYDNELVVEHLLHYVQRDGHVTLRYKGQTWTITAATPVTRPCSGCYRPIARLSYQLAGSVFCQRCMFTQRTPARRPTVILGAVSR